MRRRWIVAAVGAALLSAGAWAQWGPGMGGYGMGPGMMGGRGGWGGGGHGPGMMGGYGWEYQSLDLSDTQRDEIRGIAKESREEMWGLMQTMHGLMWNSEAPGTRSDAEVLKNFDAMTAVRREMLAARLDAKKRMEDVLTRGQREQLKKSRGW